MKSGTETEWSDIEEPLADRALVFRQKVDAGANACARGDYDVALSLYAEALALDPTNAVLYSNRSAILCKLERFEEALIDAEKAYEFNPSWIKSWFRRGYALRCLNRHASALVAYAHGLAQDPNNAQLLNAMLEAALDTSMKHSVEATYGQLKSLGLEKSPFVLVSVIGQEVLAAGQLEEAVCILEAALQIGTTSLKLRQSVLSALSSAHWSLGNVDKAVHCMQQDLAVAKSLGDLVGELRAHKNLGKARLALYMDAEALNHYRHMLSLAVKLNDQQAMISALSSLGHVYTRLFDLVNALASYQQCLHALRQLPMVDPRDIAREMGNLGNAHLALGQTADALDYFQQQQKAAEMCGDVCEHAKATANLAAVHQQNKEFEAALSLCLAAVKLSRQAKDRALEGKLCGNMSILCRALGNMSTARKWAEKMLQIALLLNDKQLEGKACCNLGALYLQSGQVESALKLHMKHLELAEQTNDKLGQQKAHGNLGLSYSAMHQIENAAKHHQIELQLSRLNSDRLSEAVAHGNIAVVHQSLHHRDQAHTHLNCLLVLAQELGDLSLEAKAHSLLGSFYAHFGDSEQAIQSYSSYLMLAQETNDVEAERRACRFLGDFYLSLEQFPEAIRYFDQELALAKDLRDHPTMAQVYCKLGQAHVAVGRLEEGLECQKYFLALAQITNDARSKFDALGQIGNILLQKGSHGAALKVFGKQVTLSKLLEIKQLQGVSYGNMASAYLFLNLEKALAYSTQQLTVYEELGDLVGQMTAHGMLGKCFQTTQRYEMAIKHYQAKAALARKAEDCHLAEADALHSSALVCQLLQLPDDAAKLFEEEIFILQQQPEAKAVSKLLAALFALGDLYFQLSKFHQVCIVFEQYIGLITAKCSKVHQKQRWMQDFEAYAGYGLALGECGEHTSALQMFEQRLSLLKDTVVDAAIKVDAYRLLAYGNFRAGHFATSVNWLEQCVELGHQVGLMRDQASWLRELAIVHAAHGESQRALECWGQATALARSAGINDWRLQCDIIVDMSSFRAAYDGKQEDCMSLLEEVLRLYEAQSTAKSELTPADHAVNMRLHFALGRCMLSGDCANIEQAEDHLQQALAAGQLAGDGRGVFEIEELLILVKFWSRGYLQDAEEQLQQLLTRAEEKPPGRTTHLSENSKSIFAPAFDTASLSFALISAYKHLLMLFVEHNKTTEALLCSEKLRLLLFPTATRMPALEQKLTGERVWDPLQRMLSDAVIVLDVLPIQNVLFCAIASHSGYHMTLTVCDAPVDESLGRVVSAARGTKTSTVNDNESFLYALLAIEEQLLGHLQHVTRLRGPLSESQLAQCVTGNNTTLTNATDLCFVADGLFGCIPLADWLPGDSSSLVVRTVPRLCQLKKSSAHFGSSAMHTDVPLKAYAVLNVGEPSNNNDASSVARLLVTDYENICNLDTSIVLKKFSSAVCIHVSNVSIGSQGIRKTVNDSEVTDICVNVEKSKRDTYLLTCRDIASQRLDHTDLVTFCAVMIDSPLDAFNLAKTFLEAGVKTVLVTLEPLSDIARQSFFECFYKHWVAGSSASEAFHEAQLATSVSRNAFVLLGASYPRKKNHFGPSLRAMLDTPEECREALRILLHLVEKATQRIATHGKELYTTEASVRSKVPVECRGWDGLLRAMDFRWQYSDGGLETSGGSQPTCIYFPKADPSGCLNRGSVVLQALLSLPQTALLALAKVNEQQVRVLELINKLKDLANDLAISSSHQYETAINTDLYESFKELFASLGLDLMHTGTNDTGVVVKTIRVGLTQRKLQATIEVLHEMFDDVFATKESTMLADVLAAGDTFATESTYSKVNAVTVARSGSFASVTRDLPSPVQRELEKLREIDFSHFSEVESDAAIGTMKPAIPARKRLPRESKRSGMLKGRIAAASSGYLSESETSHRRTAAAQGSGKGYQSEDEGKLLRKSITASKVDQFDHELLEGTARVIAVEESGVMSESSFCGSPSSSSKTTSGFRKFAVTAPSKTPLSPLKTPQSQSFVRVTKGQQVTQLTVADHPVRPPSLRPPVTSAPNVPVSNIRAIRHHVVLPPVYGDQRPSLYVAPFNTAMEPSFNGRPPSRSPAPPPYRPPSQSYSPGHSPRSAMRPASIPTYVYVPPHQRMTSIPNGNYAHQRFHVQHNGHENFTFGPSHTGEQPPSDPNSLRLAALKLNQRRNSGDYNGNKLLPQPRHSAPSAPYVGGGVMSPGNRVPPVGANCVDVNFIPGRDSPICMPGNMGRSYFGRENGQEEFI